MNIKVQPTNRSHGLIISSVHYGLIRYQSPTITFASDIQPVRTPPIASQLRLISSEYLSFAGGTAPVNLGEP